MREVEELELMAPSPMFSPEEDVSMIQDEFLKELMTKRVGSRNYDITLSSLGNKESFAIDLVVRGLTSKLHTVTTLVHCTGAKARENANKYLPIIKDKINRAK